MIISSSLNRSFQKADKYIDALLTCQLKNESFWEHFVDVFNTGIDDDTLAWRGEYFGKMMRGACLTYSYCKDEELFDLLTRTIERMLTRQDELGRFSTYSVSKEFNGWDIWCRKYVITGFLHYYDIAKDEELKNRIVAALRRHIDYIIDHIGEGKIDICTTTNFWEGMNSSSILEPIMNFYNVTKETKYLEFAKYIVDRGGTLSQNVIDLAYEDKLKPYQYNVTKAYETMSFFEGVLEYYKVTHEEKLLKAVTNFVKAVKDTDLTLIGSCGCTHELFDNSTIAQIKESELIAQETCVTVTWIRLNTKLLMFTNDVCYFENIESSFYNGMFGAINSEKEKQFTVWGEKKYYDPMFFDSYSPLTNSHRGKGIGGFQQFKDGSYFGCCTAIGAAGIALFPLTAVMEDNGTLVINNYLEGVVSLNDMSLEIDGGYLVSSIVKVKVLKDGNYSVLFRNPSWSKKTTIVINGSEKEMILGYERVESVLKEGDVIELKFTKEVTPVVIEDSIAFIYAPLVLAYDQYKQHEPAPGKLTFAMNPSIQRVEPQGEETVRFLIDGNLFSDYESCGKHYLDIFNRMSIWFKKK